MRRRCLRKKRVRVRGYTNRKTRVRVRGHTTTVCAKYAGSSPRSRSSGRRKRSRSRGSFRKGHRPFNKGKHCVRKGRNRLGRPTCRSYGGRGARGRRSGRAKFNRMNYLGPLLQRRQQRMIEARESGGGLPMWAGATRIAG